MADLSEIEKFLREKGVSEHVIGEEADYLVEHYGEDAMGAAEGALPDYLSRTNNPTGYRPFDSQSTDAAEQEANRQADLDFSGGHPSDVEFRNSCFAAGT